MSWLLNMHTARSKLHLHVTWHCKDLRLRKLGCFHSIWTFEDSREGMLTQYELLLFSDNAVHKQFHCTKNEQEFGQSFCVRYDQWMILRLCWCMRHTGYHRVECKLAPLWSNNNTIPYFVCIVSMYKVHSNQTNQKVVQYNLINRKETIMI